VNINKNPKSLLRNISVKLKENNSRTILVIFCIMVAVLIPDIMINYVSDFIVPILISSWSIFFFVIICAVYSVGQYFILRFVSENSREIRAKDRYFNMIHLIVTVAQYSLVAIMIFIVLEILITSKYHTILLTAITGVTGFLTVGILCLCAQRFFSWYRTNKNSVVVLLYASSFALFAFGLAFISVNEFLLMSEKEPIRTSQSEVIFPSDYFEPGSFLANTFDTYQYTYTIAFVILMAGTALLLHHYSKKIGRIKFWLVISLPILYKIITSLENFGLITLESDTESFYYWLITSLSTSAGGILIGIAFWTVAKTIRQDSIVKRYLIIAAFGFVLHFISNNLTLTAASYPPFGVATLIPLPLSAYMIFLGVYCTAISISQDYQVRQSIKKVATQDSNLLSSIGTAHMQQEIQRTVDRFKDVLQEQEKELEKKTGIEADMKEEDIKSYLEEVLQEVGKTKKPT
jgi:hypothetical protein